MTNETNVPSRTVLRQLAREAVAAGDHETERDCMTLLDGESPEALRRIQKVLADAAAQSDG